MERRKERLLKDTAIVKAARIAVSDVHHCCEHSQILLELLNSHDQLTSAVIQMRDSAEYILATVEKTYSLKESINIANNVLGDRDKESGGVSETKNIKLDLGKVFE